MAFWRKKSILAKAEGTYATDASPTGAANAIIALNAQITPIEAQEVRRELDRPYMGAEPTILAGQHVAMQFETEATGGGAVDTAPPHAPLFRASGLAETVNASTSVVYDPVSAAFESASLYFNLDGTLHKALGARGNLGFLLQAQQIPRWTHRFLGLIADPAATALPTETLTAWQGPIESSDTNTPTFSIHGYSAVLERLELDFGNDVQGRFLVGQENVVIVDRNVTGRAVIEAPALGTKDFFAIARAETRAALQLVHGTTAGNIVTIDAPKVQIGRPTYQNSQGFVHLVLPLTFTPDTGDDEISITFT